MARKSSATRAGVFQAIGSAISTRTTRDAGLGPGIPLAVQLGDAALLRELAAPVRAPCRAQPHRRLAGARGARLLDRRAPGPLLVLHPPVGVAQQENFAKMQMRRRHRIDAERRRKLRRISRPRSFSASAKYCTPSRGFSRLTSCSVSAICGLHFGLTKAPTTSRLMPAATSMSISLSFSSSVTPRRSICRPSRSVSSVMTTLGWDGS